MNGRHQVAVWAAAAAFFGSLLAVWIFVFVDPQEDYAYLEAFLVAFVTGGAVYVKVRLDEAKREEELKREEEFNARLTTVKKTPTRRKKGGVE
jgi:hypothetical protein